MNKKNKYEKINLNVERKKKEIAEQERIIKSNKEFIVSSEKIIKDYKEAGFDSLAENEEKNLKELRAIKSKAENKKEELNKEINDLIKSKEAEEKSEKEKKEEEKVFLVSFIEKQNGKIDKLDEETEKLESFQASIEEKTKNIDKEIGSEENEEIVKNLNEIKRIYEEKFKKHESLIEKNNKVLVLERAALKKAEEDLKKIEDEGKTVAKKAVTKKAPVQNVTTKKAPNLSLSKNNTKKGKISKVKNWSDKNKIKFQRGVIIVAASLLLLTTGIALSNNKKTSDNHEVNNSSVEEGNLNREDNNSNDEKSNLQDEKNNSKEENNSNTGKTVENEVELKSNEEIAQEVINDVWGVGEARVEALEEAGYDSDAIQKIVNELVKAPVTTASTSTTGSTSNEEKDTENEKTTVVETKTPVEIKVASEDSSEVNREHGEKVLEEINSVEKLANYYTNDLRVVTYNDGTKQLLDRKLVKKAEDGIYTTDTAEYYNVETGELEIVVPYIGERTINSVQKDILIDTKGEALSFTEKLKLSSYTMNDLLENPNLIDDFYADTNFGFIRKNQMFIEESAIEKLGLKKGSNINANDLVDKFYGREAVTGITVSGDEPKKEPKSSGKTYINTPTSTSEYNSGVEGITIK